MAETAAGECPAGAAAGAGAGMFLRRSSSKPSPIDCSDSRGGGSSRKSSRSSSSTPIGVETAASTASATGSQPRPAQASTTPPVAPVHGGSAARPWTKSFICCDGQALLQYHDTLATASGLVKVPIVAAAQRLSVDAITAIESSASTAALLRDRNSTVMLHHKPCITVTTAKTSWHLRAASHSQAAVILSLLKAARASVAAAAEDGKKEEGKEEAKQQHGETKEQIATTTGTTGTTGTASTSGRRAGLSRANPSAAASISSMSSGSSSMSSMTAAGRGAGLSFSHDDSAAAARLALLQAVWRAAHVEPPELDEDHRSPVHSLGGSMSSDVEAKVAAAQAAVMNMLGTPSMHISTAAPVVATLPATASAPAVYHYSNELPAKANAASPEVPSVWSMANLELDSDLEELDGISDDDLPAAAAAAVAASTPSTAATPTPCATAVRGSARASPVIDCEAEPEPLPAQLMAASRLERSWSGSRNNIYDSFADMVAPDGTCSPRARRVAGRHDKIWLELWAGSEDWPYYVNLDSHDAQWTWPHSAAVLAWQDVANDLRVDVNIEQH